MKKLIFVFALLCFLQGNAQTNNLEVAERKIRRLEGEIGCGLTFGPDKLNFDRNNTGATMYVEARYNLRRIPLDFGVQVRGTIFHRESFNAGRMAFKTMNLTAVTDYNFRRHQKISFFAGFGLGYAGLSDSAPITFDNSRPNWAGFSTGTKTGSFCFMPRVGVEFFHHLRVTLDYKFREKANRHFAVTIGGVFGGGSRLVKK